MPTPPPFVRPSDLPGLDRDPVLVDVRWYLDGRSGAEAYAAGHLPGAVFLDLERWLSEPDGRGGGRHPLPSPDLFTRGLAQAGIGDDDLVVAYDDMGGRVAARLVWLLRATGRAAAVLDGGVTAWDGPLSREQVQRPTADPEVRAWPEAALVDLDTLDPTAQLLLDAREAERYRGEVEPVDPRPGHVPGAVNLPASGALGPDGRLLPVGQLREAARRAGVDDGADVVASCGSGVTACFTLLVLEHAGLGRARLWPGSYSAWTADPDRPVTVGDQP